MVPDPDGTANATGLLPVDRLALITIESANQSDVVTTLPCTRCELPDLGFLAAGAYVDGDLDLVAGDGRHVVKGIPQEWFGAAVVVVYRCRECGQVFGVAQRYTPEGVALTSVNLDAPDLARLPEIGRLPSEDQ